MDEQYGRYQALIESFLSSLWDGDDTKLAEAMRYSLLSEGKRIRPVITLAFCEMCGGKPEDALNAACAIELIHTYSLIHDDLPCMDNDDFRRGKPTNHKVYGEAMALLAGDGVLSYALLISMLNREAAEEIALAAFYMVKGQALEFEGSEDTHTVHTLKTGALFRAAARAGCIIAGASKEKLEAATAYAAALGLAFQYRDDILDMESNCQSKVDELTQTAKEALAPFDNSAFLMKLTDWLSQRKI